MVRDNQYCGFTTRLLQPRISVDIFRSHVRILSRSFNSKVAKHYGNVANALLITIEILGPILNLFSCLILFLVLCLIFKISR